VRRLQKGIHATIEKVQGGGGGAKAALQGERATHIHVNEDSEGGGEKKEGKERRLGRTKTKGRSRGK